MSDKYIKEITQNIPNNELNAACDALMNNSLNETSDYEEVSMEELNEYIEGLECQAEELRTQLAKANERVAKLERENTNGNAAAELLIWWAKKLSNAPNEDLKEVIRIGYKRIVNLANLIGEEQLRKEQNND